jgi:hypothetical protein
MLTKDGDALARGAVALATALSLTLACKKEEKKEPTAAVAGSTERVIQAASGDTGAPLTGLDSCLVGKWTAEKVTLKVDPVSAEGGKNVMLEVAPSGLTSVDFTPMSEIHASAKGGLSFDFKYTGTVSGTLKTPERGLLRSENTSLAELRVSASMKLPNGGMVPLFKDTKVQELANLGSAMAGAVPKLPGAPSAPAVSPTQGIDANPVFSSSGYTCQGDSLSLANLDGAARWTFRRAP